MADIQRFAKAAVRDEEKMTAEIASRLFGSEKENERQTQAILNTLIRRIDAHEPVKTDGELIQKIDVHYKGTSKNLLKSKWKGGIIKV